MIEAFLSIIASAVLGFAGVSYAEIDHADDALDHL
jgi:hypothetical protein